MKTKNCFYCGNEIDNDDFTEIDNLIVCQECFDEKYWTCQCGNVDLQDNMYWIESEDTFVCQDCLDNDYVMCNDCSEYVRYNDAYTINDGYNNNYYICDACFNNGDYYYCENCGDYFYIDNIHFHNDLAYCDTCYEDEYASNNNRLYDYHEFREWHLFKSDNEDAPKYYVGCEIELEPKSSEDVVGVLNAISKNINAVGMHDSSLSYGGVEVVSHPETPLYREEHKENYKKFFDAIKELDYGNNGGCGLHFHVSRPNDNVISRVIILLESFKTEIKRLSRRDNARLNQWSKFLTDTGDVEENTKYQSSKYLKETYINAYHNRYTALNLNNSATIEFRFFNGVNTFEQYWGALQFIQNLMNIALDEDKDISQINWQDLLVGDELREQARKRDVIDINKYAKDKTDILEKIEKQKQELKEQIKKTLNNMIRYLYKELEETKIEKIPRKTIKGIRDNATTYVHGLTDTLIALNDTIDFYNRVDNYSIYSIKDTRNYIDRQTRNKYTKYFNKIDKLINDYEKGVE